MKFFISQALLLQVLFCSAQEEIVPLSTNLNLRYAMDAQNTHAPANFKMAGTNSLSPIQLPFLEDFFYATQFRKPDVTKWSDSAVYINSGFPIAPPSIGVATFDGLNCQGYPYEPDYSNLNEARPADTLTSRDIDLYQSGSQILTPSDSISFSFYYQARGNGEPPESGDSLLLDFFRPSDSVWVHNVWYSKGNSNPNLIDTAFKRVYIPIDTVAYLKNNFKFRFRNKATTSGNFDHWHVDYIYLNKNRSYFGDTVYNDLTFAHVPSSFLKDYASMPYHQYNASEMASRNSVRIKNNGSSTINMSYENKFYDQQNNVVHSYNGGANNLSPFKPNGYSNYQSHSNPQFGYVFSQMNDSSDFTIKHFLYRSQGVSPDFLLENDTIYQKQVFRNYYAYDDGTAEGGYYVSGVNSKFAIRFNTNYTDTLRAVRIYFDPAGGLTNSQQISRFRICVWANSGGAPGALIHRDSAMYVRFYDTLFKLVPEYKINGDVVLSPGSYFIGIQQEIASGIVVGFDRNYNYSQNLYYNSNGTWMPSQIKGSLMFRPVFGKIIPSPAALREDQKVIDSGLNAYPNPSHSFLNITFERAVKRRIELQNTLGQPVIQFESSEAEVNLDTGLLAQGIYVLRVKETNKKDRIHKILIQR